MKICLQCEEDEREDVPLCLNWVIGAICWSFAEMKFVFSLCNEMKEFYDFVCY